MNKLDPFDEVEEGSDQEGLIGTVAITENAGQNVRNKERNFVDMHAYLTFICMLFLLQQIISVLYVTTMNVKDFFYLPSSMTLTWLFVIHLHTKIYIMNVR